MSNNEDCHALVAGAANYAADAGLGPETTFRVLPVEGTWESRRHAAALTAYLNSPEVKAKVVAEAVARTVNVALYGPDPSKWPT